MYIDELAQEQEITLSVKRGDTNLEFKTIVRDTIPKKHAILTDVITNNDKIISFNTSGIVLDVMVYPSDSAPMVFRNVRVLLHRDKEDNVFYVITSSSVSAVVNRRESYRLFVGEKIEIQKGFNHSVEEAILKDISTTGFAVKAEKSKLDLMVNQMIHTVFSDRIEEMYHDFSFQLYGIIVRKEEHDDGSVIYGCRLNSKVPGLERYITLKERIRLKNKNGR